MEKYVSHTKDAVMLDDGTLPGVDDDAMPSEDATATLTDGTDISQMRLRLSTSGLEYSQDDSVRWVYW